MPTPRRRRAPKPDRRAIELLASCSDVGGCSEAILRAHGFSIGMMVRLVRTGLATANSERVVAGGKTMEVTTLRITDAGRKALEEAKRQDFEDNVNFEIISVVEVVS